ncbi:protein kinase domain-containing protein [Leptothermofonsia sp. ETS-13]|uniref:protein kinase domain-containing protein n=1 Tax=Leptothermofonsia sp. ETS-13 TaxID=3035696 RepID=UPI003B9E91C3
MTFCLNPDCQQPQNTDDTEYCLSCGSKLTPLLRGRYRVVRLTGQGGFGRTYLAEDEDRLKAPCIVKQFSPQIQGTKSLEKAIQLFGQEAVRLHELGEHPQIPTLLAYFEQDKRLYLVQQFIEGQTLAQEMSQQGPFNEQKIREVLAGVLPILKFIHDKQVIHRDITPSNIIRRKSDNKLVLIDFGVAKLLSAETAAQPGTKIGTEGYAPMEQLRSGKAFPASDLYSLGATCLYLMTQMKPDDLYDPLEGRWLWREQLKLKGQSLSEPIGQILDKMLKDLVGDRYQSADAVMKDLRTALSRPLTAASAGAVASRMAGSAPSSTTSTPRLSGQPAVPSQPLPPSGTPSRPPTFGQSPGARSLPSKPPISGSQNRRCLHTLSGHSSWVMAVAMSPDGWAIASGGLDNIIRIWNRETGELLETLSGHSRPINCLTISPDSQVLVSCSDDDTVKVWELASGKLLLNLKGHTRDVNSVVISADGKLLASGSEDRTIILWQLATGEALKTFQGLAGMIRSVALSPDGQILASGGLDNQIKLWSLKTGGQIRTFAKGHFSAVNAVVITPDSKMLVSGSKDKTIKVWDMAKGEVLRVLAGHTDSVNAIALAPNGKLLASGSSDSTIRIWNLDTGELRFTLNDHTSAVNSLAFSANGQYLVSASSDGTVKVWQLM